MLKWLALGFLRLTGWAAEGRRPDVRQDMDEIRAFYADKQGRFPELFGEIRLKEEM